MNEAEAAMKQFLETLDHEQLFMLCKLLNALTIKAKERERQNCSDTVSTTFSATPSTSNENIPALRRAGEERSVKR